MTHRLLLSVLALAAILPAQTVFVVDGLNRPGTHFTDLPAAVAAASDGDVLRVMADGGSYTAIQTSKALTIGVTGGPGLVQAVVIAGNPFTIAGLAPGKQFTLSGFLISGGNTGGPLLRVANCAGRVVLDRIEVMIGAPSLEITASAAVVLQESRVLGGYPSVRANNSNLVITGGQISGGPATSIQPALSSPAVELQQCVADLAMCQFTGGNGQGTRPQSPALRLFNSVVRAGAPGVLCRLQSGFATLGGLAGVAAVDGSSSLLRVDSDVRIVPSGGAPPTTGIFLATGTFPSLGSDTRTSFQQLIHSANTGTVVTVTGLPADPFALPGVDGLVWIDLRFVVWQFGRPLVVIPNQLPPGTTLVTQVVDLSGNGAISNPTLLVVR